MVVKLSDFLTTSLVLTALDSNDVLSIVRSNTIGIDSNTTGDYVASITAGTGISSTGTGHAAAVNLSVDNTVVTLDSSQTLTNKTFNLTNNTFTATLAQLNAAVSGATLVSLDGGETLTNKTLTSPTINGGSFTSGSVVDVTTFGLRDVTTTAYETRIRSNNASPVLSADRTLTLDVNNADRTISLKGNLTTVGNVTLNGNHSKTITSTATTNVTLPTSGTLISDSTHDAIFNSAFSAKSTTDLTEGTNLYYTSTRVDSDIDGRVTKTFVDNLGISASTLGTVDSTQFVRSDGDDTMDGQLTIDGATNNVPLIVKSTDQAVSVRFQDNIANDTINYNGQFGTFSIGGTASVSGKKLHVDGAMSVGSTVDGTAAPSNGLLVQGEITASGGETVYHTGNFDSAQYLKSNAADSASGAITFGNDVTFKGSSATFLNVNQFTNANSSNLDIKYKTQSTTSSASLNLYEGSTRLGNLSYWNGAAFGGQPRLYLENNVLDVELSLGKRASLDSDLFARIGGTEYRIWHEGNDGATSGLDADTLDGQHGSHYRIDVYDASGTLLN